MEVKAFAEIPQPPMQNWTIEQASEVVRDAFLNNIRVHLRSDVPVGTCLSGGIDSSSILACMRHLGGTGQNIHAFTYVADSGAISEEKWADIVAKSSRATMHRLRLRSQEFADDFEHFMAMHDQPIGTIAIYAQYRIYKMAHDAGIKVLLDGQGADELLAGYQRFVVARMWSLFQSGHFGAILSLQKDASAMGALEKPRFFRQMMASSLPRAVRQSLKKYERRPHATIRQSWFIDRGLPLEEYCSLNTSGMQELRQQMLTKTSLPALLRYQDRNSMAHSVESRLPFLTTDFLSLICSLPESYLIDDTALTKAVFRRAMKDIVPREILERREKIGFAVPITTWIDELQPWIDERLRRCAELPFLNRDFILQHWERVRTSSARTDPACFLIWRWIGLLGWVEAHRPDFS